GAGGGVEVLLLDLGHDLVGVQADAAQEGVDGLGGLARLVLVAGEALLEDAGGGGVVDSEGELGLLAASLGEVGGYAGLEGLGEDALGDLVGVVEGIGI